MTARLQIELGIDTRVTDPDTRQDTANEHTTIFVAHHDITNAKTIVSGIRHDVSNTQPIISDVRSDVANTRTTASDIHRSKLKGHGGLNGQNQVVSTIRTFSSSKYLPLLRLTLGRRSRLRLNPVSNIYIQRTRRVTASAIGKYAWNRLPYSSRRRFRGSSWRYEH